MKCYMTILMFLKNLLHCNSQVSLQQHFIKRKSVKEGFHNDVCGVAR